MSNLEELRQDSEELRGFITKSNRARVKDALQRELLKVEQEIALLCREKTAQAEKPKDEQASNAAPEGKESQKPSTVPSFTTKITSYGWDQSDKFVKVYITLPGVEKVPKEGLVSNFSNKSIDVVVRDLNGKNYQLKILRLNREIIPGASYLKAKSGTLTVMLKKEKVETWDDVVYKEKKDLKSSFEENKDPSEGIMDMMKKMYDEGDDEMKKTISKAWLESREKQGAGLV